MYSSLFFFPSKLVSGKTRMNLWELLSKTCFRSIFVNLRLKFKWFPGIFIEPLSRFFRLIDILSTDFEIRMTEIAFSSSKSLMLFGIMCSWFRFDREFDYPDFNYYQVSELTDFQTTFFLKIPTPMLIMERSEMKIYN